MSTESLRQFLSAASSDSGLKQKLAAATDSVNFVKIAEESGYSFSLEDLQTYIAQHNNGELSEDELDAVAGGRSHAAVDGNSPISGPRRPWPGPRGQKPDIF